MNTSAKSIIGIGGLPRSGKDSLAEFFIEAGFYGVSLGDIVREEARKRHSDKSDPISVVNMTETSNWLRSEHGPDFALKEAQKRFAQKLESHPELKGLVVFSVRAPAEVDYILQHQGELIWVEASDETRYQRAMNNLREGEARIDLSEFKRQENLQWQPQADLPAEVQMNTKYVKEHATTIFNNETDYETFKHNAQKLVEQLSKES